MNVLVAVLPVFLMLVVGIICSHYQIIDQHGIDSVKKIVTNILLPFVLFNALSTATYNGTTALILVVMITQLMISLVTGFFLRSRIAGGLSSHVPFLLSGFEGGMVGYPLWIALMGVERLYKIATVDLANCIYAFTLYLALIIASQKGSSNIGEVLRSALQAPALYGVVLGVVFGLTHAATFLIESRVGELYLAMMKMLTSPVSALILITVGYNLKFDRKVISAAVRTAGMRLVLQSVLLIGVWYTLKSFITDPVMHTAILLYAFLPPMFISAIYVDNEAKAEYASTTTSMYMIVSVAAFTLLAIFRL